MREIVFAGPRKNFELFAADPRLSHAAVEYRRGSLRERLAVWDDLKALAAGTDCLIIDPDSRLTQLGLLPIGDEARYHLFESRGYGGESDRSAARPGRAVGGRRHSVWRAHAPYVAPVGETIRPARHPYIAVSLGVGENPAKRIAGSVRAGAAAPA